jgi:hypothetical protein
VARSTETIYPALMVTMANGHTNPGSALEEMKLETERPFEQTGLKGASKVGYWVVHHLIPLTARLARPLTQRRYMSCFGACMTLSLLQGIARMRLHRSLHHLYPPHLHPLFHPGHRLALHCRHGLTRLMELKAVSLHCALFVATNFA